MFYRCNFQVVEFIKYRRLSHISYTHDIDDMFNNMFNNVTIKTVKFGHTITGENSSPDNIRVDSSVAGAQDQLNKFMEIYGNWMNLTNTEECPCNIYVTRQLKGELRALFEVIYGSSGSVSDFVDTQLSSIFGETDGIIFV
jgi:hypothetical protein